MDRFLIAPLDQGQQTNLKPWLILDESFALQRNMYTWRGSVKKRFGTRVMNESVSAINQQLLSRLRIKVGTTNGSGTLAGTVPGSVFKVGQQFSVGSEIFTVYQTGAVQIMYTTGSSTTHTYSTTNGAFNIVGAAAATDVYFYPAEPVLELATYQVTALSDETLIAFDTQFSYKFTYATGWDRVGTALFTRGTPTTGTNFYWTTNYRSSGAQTWVLFVTNNQPILSTTPTQDGIWYLNNNTWTQIGTFATTPIFGTKFLATAGVFIQYKNRLLAFDVDVGDTGTPDVFIRYPNTLFFSKEGSPVDADSWLQQPGKGGFLIAPVQQRVIGAQFLKDQLIVYFEDSTWQLIFTGNTNDPFRFQQINTELGMESANSIVPFDKVVLGIGANGIHACNGLNVERIDRLIPYQVFGISNSNLGPQRVNGIRDFYLELVYWSFAASSIQDNFSNIYPNRVLVYDYVNETWAYNDDSITALGNYQYQFGLTWADISGTWEEVGTTWGDPSFTDRFRSVIGGNQEGFTFILDPYRFYNAQVLSITDISISGSTITLKVIDHNLPSDSYVYVTNITGSGTLSTINNQVYQIAVTGTDTFTITKFGISGTYTGGGNVGRVSELEIYTKQYNFYNKVGNQIGMQKVDFLVDSTDFGQITVDFLTSSSDEGLIEQGVATGAILGSSILETFPYSTYSPLEATQERFWHSVYFNSFGENVQLHIYFSPAQILDSNVAFSDLQINAILFHVEALNQFGSVTT